MSRFAAVGNAAAGSARWPGANCSMEIVTEAGASLAVPVQRTIVERAAAGENHIQQTAQQVQQWRENDQLYLPSFPEGVVAELRNTLDFPPKGAPPT